MRQDRMSTHQLAFVALLLTLCLAAHCLSRWSTPGERGVARPAIPSVSPRAGEEAARRERGPGRKVAPSGGTELHVAEQPPGACVRLQGIVNSLVGVPLPGVALGIATSAGGEPLHVKSDAAGRFGVDLVLDVAGEVAHIYVDGDDQFYGVTTYTTAVSCGSDPIELRITLVATTDRCWVSGNIRWHDGSIVKRGLVGPSHRSFVDADDLGRFSLLMSVWGGSISLAYGAREPGAFCAGSARIQVSQIQLAAGRVDDVVLTLERPSQTRLLEVVDPEQHPLPGVRVLWNGRPPELSTDSQGRLEVRFGASAIATIALERAGFGRLFIGLSEGEGGDVVRATLYPTRLLRGFVRDETGVPSPGAQVWASVTGTFMAQDRISMVTDAMGRFHFAATEDGLPLYMTARARDGGTGHAIHKGSIPDDALAITVVKGEPLDGVVVDSQGAPIREALVIAYREDRREFDPLLFNTGEDGRFLLQLRPGGTYRIQASRTGYRRVEQPIDDRAFLQIQMTPSGRLAGQVRGPDRGLLPRFRVRVLGLDEEDPEVLVPWTHFSGAGSFEVLIPGADVGSPCRLEVESEEFGRVALETEIQAPQPNR